MKKDMEMLNVVGGINLSGSIINAVAYLWKTIYSIGQNFGGALRRIASGRVCRI